jgi:hypothetical protein
MMHDVANDIMASSAYSLPEKAAEIVRLRDLMSYGRQDQVEAPGMPMGDGHEMSMGAMHVPTRLPDGAWLPQGHPDARMASMQEMMQPLPPVSEPSGAAR